MQCGSRAVNTDGDPGLESLSVPVTVSRTDGICEPRVFDSIGAEPFTARLRYTGGWRVLVDFFMSVRYTGGWRV